MTLETKSIIVEEIGGEALLSAIGDGSNDAITRVDVDGKIRAWTLGAERMLGYKREEVLGQSIELVIPPEQRARERERIRLQFTGSLDVVYEETIRISKSGARIPVLLTRVPLKNDEGRTVELVAILSDISEQKRLQKQVEALQRNTAMARVAAKVAHEIRTPLGVLFLKSDLLVERLRLAFENWGQGNAEPHRTILEKYVADIQKQISRLEEIAKNYLHLSKTQSMERVELNLRLLMRDIFTELKEAYKEDKVVFEMEIPDYLPTLRLDPQQFQRVFMNLVRNSVEAIRFAQLEKGVIRIGIRREEQSILFEVQDNGPGIPEEIQHNIFDPFTTSKNIGTGLGLYLVREIVENHGGQIAIVSKAGQGTLVRISIPLEEVGKA